MRADYVWVWGDDVVLIDRCDSLRDAYRVVISSIIKDRRGGMPDRGSVHPPAQFVEVREAVMHFKDKCQLLAVNCYL